MFWIVLALLSEPFLASKDPQRGVSHKHHTFFWPQDIFVWFRLHRYVICFNEQQRRTNCENGTGGDTCGLAKARVYKMTGCGPPAYTIKQGHCCGHCRCSLLALCCSKSFLGLALLLRCIWLLFAWASLPTYFFHTHVFCKMTGLDPPKRFP